MELNENEKALEDALVSTREAIEDAIWHFSGERSDTDAVLCALFSTQTRLRAALIFGVRVARDAGFSWEVIGESLEITRQGAWEAFHGYTDD